MGEIFRVSNFSDINLQDTTNLTADAASGQPSIATLGNVGFEDNDYGILGYPGSLTGELLKIQSFTSTGVTFTTNLINLHRQTEPFTTVFGNKIKCYRAPNINNYPPSDAVFFLNPLSIADIDQDSPITFIFDPSGSNAFWYKFTYLNDVTNAETALSSSVPLRGGGYGHYVSVEDIRREAGLTDNQQIQDTQIATRRDQAESEVKGGLIASDYVLPLQDNLGNFYCPPVIANITRLLAAGYVLEQDYGPIAPDSSKDGARKIKEALGLLTEVQDHTIILVDINEQQMATQERVKGSPTSQTAYVGNDVLAGNPPEAPIFTMSKIF